MKKVYMFMGLVSLGLLITGCAKQADNKALEGVVVFTVGSVNIVSGDSTTPAAVSSRILKGESLVTGSGSAATVQISDIGIIQILEKTTIKLDDLFSRNRIDVNLSEGKVIARVNKLKRGDSFNVKTPTSVAAVRGTEFSTSYSSVTNISSVAVREGRVLIMVPRESGDSDFKDSDLVEKASLEPGKAAEVSLPERNIADTEPATSAIVTVREIKPSERVVIEEISLVPVLDNVEDKSKEEIEELSKPAAVEPVKIDSEVKETVNSEKVEKLIQQKTATIEEIKEAFNRVDEITLYSGKIVKGAIISRGSVIRVLTSSGTIEMKETDIQGVRIIR